MQKLACLFLILAASGCPDVKVDENEGTAPLVEFDPANKIIPFPNNLLLSPVGGKVNLPAQCGETATAKALREGVLNQLDGFGLYEVVQTVSVTDDVDLSSVANRIVLYKRMADTSTAMSIPVVAQMGTTIRYDANCENPTQVPQLAIIPRLPLDQRSSYVVAILDGITTTDGRPFSAAGAWGLVRNAENPVTIENGVVVDDRTPLDPSHEEDLAQLMGIDLLWKVHAPLLKYLAEDLPADKRVTRDKILLAWEFKTQTSTDPLDPAVAGSLAASVNTIGLQAVASITGGATAEQFLAAVLPMNSCTSSGGPIPCNAVGAIEAGGLVTKSYLSESPNPVAGTCMTPDFLGCPVRGQWADPISPAVVKPNEIVQTLVITPAAACPTEGCPTVIFAHAIGQSKTNAFAIAPQLAAAGFATVAIDAVAHDSRAIRISSDAARGCGGARPSPLTAPQCFAPFLSPNLGATRDNIRQTILDYHGLLAALKACNTTACGTFKPDTTKLYYVGQSLGGILGAMTVATTSAFKSSILNVGGAGWADLLENTQDLRLRCFLVDGLIDAGILQGAKSSPPGAPTTGLCLTDAWKTQPGYRQFSVIGRWVLDPAEPGNFALRLRARRLLIQEVENDAVVPNLATDNLAKLAGLTQGTADPCTTCAGPPPVASAAITTNPMTSKWVLYKQLPAAAPFPGNTFTHGSLLKPETLDPDRRLGTARLQADALVYLLNNP